MLTNPVKFLGDDKGRVVGMECIEMELGEPDDSGRRRPVPIEGTEHIIDFDTLIIAISEDSGKDCISAVNKAGIETNKNNSIKSNPQTFLTSREGVFAIGDVVTGPNTVIEAIAAGKKAAIMIDRYNQGKPLDQPEKLNVPSVYIEPVAKNLEAIQQIGRAETPRAPAEWRKRNFSEVEVSLSIEEATHEACRCLRCDLEFTKAPVVDENINSEAIGGKTA